MTLTPEHLDQLRQARHALENPGLAARLTNALGSPIERMVALLPEGASATISTATRKSLEAGLKLALTRLPEGDHPPASRRHRWLAAASGGAGGAFGLPALAVELPLSTTLILRAIADIARSEGETLTGREAQLACLSVFALGGPTGADDGTETGYFGVRAALAQTITDAAGHIARHGLSGQGAPALVQLISKIAARFSVPVSQKMAAQAVPVIGAAGGATVNTLFMNHFQSMARGHFTVRRLERLYGSDVIEKAYRALGQESLD